MRIEPIGNGPAVVAHIGEPKTGTTHVQDILWRNRPALAAAGVQLAGHSVADQFRAMQDLRLRPPEPDDPSGSWVGEWDVLAAQARRARRLAVISQESLAAADADRVEHAVRTLGPDVHVVLTVRDFAGLLPAEWQETVKHRRTHSWTDWLELVRTTEPAPGTRPDWGFWRVHDTVEVLRIWSRHVPLDHLHVVTVPPRGGDPDLLWRRLAGLFGVADLDLDTSVVRSNPSLGLAETEFLRRLNRSLADAVPNWFYAREVKETLAHDVLAMRSGTPRPALPPSVADWARRYGERTVAALRSYGVDVVGDLDDLVPGPAAPASPAQQAGRAGAGDQLDVGVHALTTLIERPYRRTVERTAREPTRTPTGLAMRVIRSSPRMTRVARRLGTRRGGWVRVAAWRAHEVASARRARDVLEA